MKLRAVGEEKIPPMATASNRPSPRSPRNAGSCPEPPPVTTPTLPACGAARRRSTRGLSVAAPLSAWASNHPASMSSTTWSGLLMTRFNGTAGLLWVVCWLSVSFVQSLVECNGFPIGCQAAKASKRPARARWKSGAGMKIVDFMGIFPAHGGRALLPWVFPRLTHSLTSRVIAHTKSDFRPRFPTPIPMSASPAAPLLLHAQGIAKSFKGVAALRDGRLALRAGSVHALCGGNGAGKSTFLNILMGLLRRDAGTLQVDGVAVDFASPAEALAARFSIITQELSPIPGMPVAENIFLGREPRKAGVMIDYKRLFAVAGALLQRLRFGIDPRAPMHRLSLAQTQLVEIAKAFSHARRVLIMDEPTSAIGEQEAQTLFQAIRGVTAQGAGVIYVSHRLSEIFAIA